MADQRTKSTLGLCLFVTLTILASTSVVGEPTPKPFPDQFHSILVMNSSGKVDLIDLWYDWPNGRNFNIIRHQLGNIQYDLEWNNGTAFVYIIGDDKECQTLDFGVGLLPPDWVAGGNYLGQREFAGFLCNVWEKVGLVLYYEDVVTRRPVHWQLYTGKSAQVMSFDVGAVLDDSEWQAPAYCFDQTADLYQRDGVASTRVLIGAIAGSIGLL